MVHAFIGQCLEDGRVTQPLGLQKDLWNRWIGAGADAGTWGRRQPNPGILGFVGETA